MTESLPIVVTALTARQIREADDWWRINRTATPNAVRKEVQQAFILIAGQPRIGSRAKDVALQNVRRIFLPTIKYYLYYRVLGEPERIEIVALWHRRRGSRPPI